MESKEQKRAVTVIIPNFNGLDFLKTLFDSLKGQKCKDFEVLVVDNASTDGSREWLVSNNIPAVFLEENKGFAGGVNAGIKAAHTEFVLLLNNDTVADPGFVGELLKEIKRSPQIFAVSAKMIQIGDTSLMDDAGDMYSLMGWAYQRGVGRSSKGYNRTMDVFSACAAGAIYRREVFEHIGYFDEMHFAYLEDIDVCYRAKLFGYHNRYCPKAILYHAGSATSGSRYNPFKVRLAARNNIYLVYKNMPFGQVLVNLPFLAAGTAVKYVFFKDLGFGSDYLDGIREALKTLKKCRKVPYSQERLSIYLSTEWEMIAGTAIYTYEFASRQLGKVLKKLRED